MKTHFQVKVAFSTEVKGACGRSKHTSTNSYGLRLTTNTFAVDCLRCQNSDAFILAHDEAKSRQHAAYMAQEPHTIVPMFGRVNSDGVMECYNCKGILFREKPRSLHSYHYVCANCDTSMFPLTETGMSS